MKKDLKNEKKKKKKKIKVNRGNKGGFVERQSCWGKEKNKSSFQWTWNKMDTKEISGGRDKRGKTRNNYERKYAGSRILENEKKN